MIVRKVRTVMPVETVEIELSIEEAAKLRRLLGGLNIDNVKSIIEDDWDAPAIFDLTESLWRSLNPRRYNSGCTLRGGRQQV